MAGNTEVEHITDSLAFEVEALPQDDVLAISNTSKATPLNLKIRVRKKDEALFEQGIVSVPKLGQRKKPPEQIRLVSSDQTVLSFKVFVDTIPDKKPAKKRKRFFGGCLSSEDNDDDPYMDSNSTTISRSTDIVKQNFGLSKTENVQDMQLQPKKPVLFLGNRCKPGGCLDPPLDEDKYSYEPNAINNKINVQGHSETKEQSQHLPTDDGILIEAVPISTEGKTNKEESDPIDSSVQSIFKADFVNSSLEAQNSDSIITYPSNEISDDMSDKPSKSKRTSGEARKSFPEYRERYFIPPKSSTYSRNNSDARKGTQNLETFFSGRHSTDNKSTFSQNCPNGNTFSNSKLINDLKNTSGIDYKEIQTKRSLLLDETSKFGSDANKLQSKECLHQPKEENYVTSTLKSEAVLTTPLLIVGETMHTVKSDNINNNIQSENCRNSIDTALKTSIHAMPSEIQGILNSESITDKETKETLSICDSAGRDESTIYCKKVDALSNFSYNTEQNESLASTISKKDTKLQNEIFIKTKQDDTSREDISVQNEKITVMISTTQLIDQPIDRHPSVEIEVNISKVNSEICSQVISQIEENKDIVSLTTSLTRLDKSSQIISNQESNKDKILVDSSTMAVKKKSQVCRNEKAEKVSQTSSHISKESNRADGNLDEIGGVNTQIEDKNIDSQKYQDDNSSVDTFDRTSNNDPLDNIARNIKDEKGKRDAQNEDEIKDSIIYKEALLNNYPFGRTQNNDSIEMNARNFKDKNYPRDSKHEKENVDSKKYRNADLSDYKFDMSQNNKSLKDKAHGIKDKSDKRDTQNEAKNRHADKYKQADLNADKFYQSKNIYPVGNEVHYNNDKSAHQSTKHETKLQDSNKDQDADNSKNTNNQRDTDTLEFKDYQQINATGDNGHKNVDNDREKERVSVLQEQDFGKNNSSEPTQHCKKYSNTEDEKRKPRFENVYENIQIINKIPKKYTEYYERSSPDSNFVNIDLTFHSYVNDQNQCVIKTLDSLKDIKRRPQDNVTIIKSQMQFDAHNEFKIPINNQRNLTLEVKASGYQKLSSFQTAGSDLPVSDNGQNFAKVPSQHSQTYIPEIESFQNLLTNIYDQQLLPLQSLICDLKKDVDMLASQQMWFKENLKKSKMAKTIRLTHSNRKCLCHRNITGRK